MDTGLKNTLSGNDVVAGDDLLKDLPPEAVPAALALLKINATPTKEETAQGTSQAAAMFAPLFSQLEQLKSPAGMPVPPQASQTDSILGLLAAGIAGQVNPALAEPTLKEFQRQKDAAAAASAYNQQQADLFERQKTSARIEAMAKQAGEASDIAAQLGDRRAAAEEALQSARLQDALERRRTKESIAEQNAAKLAQIRASASARYKLAIDLKTKLKTSIDGLDLSPAGKARLKTQAEFLGTYLQAVTKPNPLTGESDMSPEEALQATQAQFDAFLTQQLRAEGKLTPTVTDSMSVPGFAPPRGPQAKPKPAPKKGSNFIMDVLDAARAALAQPSSVAGVAEQKKATLQDALKPQKGDTLEAVLARINSLGGLTPEQKDAVADTLAKRFP